MRIRRLLHATDFSPASTRAFKYAVDLATMHRAQLVILHVMTPPALGIPGEGYVTPAVYETLEASARSQAGRRLDAIVARAKKAGARARGLLLEGVPHELIVRSVRSQKADLLVIGTHGRSGLAKFFLGSVANRLVSMAACPVLTVRGR
ncbi:MAG TPA: universal stress protein [Candidatus Dormibacteraeota bacterium]|jgi:nucleotide-binding universal stress UspA family protein|nr:universal stress protein [Candidatus Dormibacteraeota bacterium]